MLVVVVVYVDKVEQMDDVVMVDDVFVTISLIKKKRKKDIYF
jgi:hypothetical protein